MGNTDKYFQAALIFCKKKQRYTIDHLATAAGVTTRMIQGILSKRENKGAGKETAGKLAIKCGYAYEEFLALGREILTGEIVNAGDSINDAPPILQAGGDYKGPANFKGQHSGKTESEYTHVPLYDIKGSAGPGTVVDGEHVKDLLAFRTTWLRKRVAYDVNKLSCITVEGDSMRPTISDGDIVLIDHNANRVDGVCAINLDGLVMIKRLQRMPSDKILVKSDNPDYDVMEVSEDNGVSLIVIGKVVWLGRTF